MKKELIALGAALALVGTLTACSSTPADQNKGAPAAALPAVLPVAPPGLPIPGLPATG